MSVSPSKIRKDRPTDSDDTKQPAATRRRVVEERLPPVDDIPEIEGVDSGKVTLLWLGDAESSEAWSVNEDSLMNFIADAMRSKTLRGKHAGTFGALTVEQFIHRYISCWANFRVSKCFRNWLMTRKPSVARRTDINRMKPLALAVAGDVYAFYSYTHADSNTHHIWNMRGITMDHEGNAKCADYADCTYARVYAEFEGNARDPEAYSADDYADPNAPRNVVPEPLEEEEEEEQKKDA